MGLFELSGLANNKIFGSSLKELIQMKGSRGRGADRFKF